MPPTGIQPQIYVVALEQPIENQTRYDPVWLLSCSNICPTDIQDSEEPKTTIITGDTTILPFMITTPLIEENMLRDGQTIELYLPITSTLILKPKQETLYVTPDIENNLTVPALVDSGAYVRAIAQNDLDTIKQ